MNERVIGVDNGGTVIKAALFDLHGKQIQVASRQTPVITPRPGYTERNMEEVWRLNCECIREVVDTTGVSPEEIIGVAVCGHGKGLYLWGKEGKPAYNGIVSTDNRAWKYSERWASSGTSEKLYPRLCQKLIPSQQASLLAWMKENEPGVYDKVQWVFSAKDYIRFRMTGEAYCEATDISGSGLMNVRDARFDRDLLEELGIGEVFDKLAPLKYSADLCGTITSETAELTGLKEGTPVAGGMFDIDACAIAMDVTTPEQLCTITGTWSINEFISDKPILGTDIAMNSLYAIPGYYLLEECSPTSAGNLEWVLENCLRRDTIPEGKNLYEHVNELAASVVPEECDLYYLPFLYGSNRHPLARATFAGLNSYHRDAHLLRAVFEGVAFSHKYHIDKLLSARKPPAAVRMAGGAANSPLWVQIFADILGFPVETVRGVSELGALGSAMAAAVAGGVYGNYHEAAQSMVRVNPPVEPDAAAHEIYKKKYRKYSALCGALDTVWDQFTV